MMVSTREARTEETATAGKYLPGVFKKTNRLGNLKAALIDFETQVTVCM